MRADHRGHSWSLVMNTKSSPLPFLPGFSSPLSCFHPHLPSPSHGKYFKKCLKKKKMKVTNEDTWLRLSPVSSPPVCKSEQRSRATSARAAAAHQTSASRFPSVQRTKATVPAQLSRSPPRKQQHFSNTLTPPGRNTVYLKMTRACLWDWKFS